ncbi:hypothetical protein [Streptomyces sp. NBC_00470]|uniref:hypothetical protein n=1 Tax=Streptomyces sp. NBC_00470 TaxID=2975753 RepID=UPI002F90C582
MAVDPGYVVVTTGADGRRSEYVSDQALDAAHHILIADQFGARFHEVFAVGEDAAREMPLAELFALAAPAGPGWEAQVWRNAQASWLVHQLSNPPDGETPWGRDMLGNPGPLLFEAAEQWAATFRTPLPDAVADHPSLNSLPEREWQDLHSHIRLWLPLLEHEAQWRREGASPPEWSWQQYRDAWLRLDTRRPAFRSSARFFLRMALDRDPRAGRIAGFVGQEHDAVEQWARVAYAFSPEELQEAEGLEPEPWHPEDGDRSDLPLTPRGARLEQAREANSLYDQHTPGWQRLEARERAWAQRWPSGPADTQDPGPVDRETEFGRRLAAQQKAAREQKAARRALFAFVDEHHHEIVDSWSEDLDLGPLQQAWTLALAAYPSVWEAREDAARQLVQIGAQLASSGAPERELEEQAPMWMALGRVYQSLKAMDEDGEEPEDPDVPDVPVIQPVPVPEEMSSVLRVGVPGGPYTVTSVPRQALSAWLEQDRPGPDSLFPRTAVRIEESREGGAWQRLSPRRLVEQERARPRSVWDHWLLDRELAGWLLADEPEGLRPEEMGQRWVRQLGGVPPRGPVLAWVTRLSSSDVEAGDVLERIQQGAHAARASIYSSRSRDVVYRPERERASAAKLAELRSDALPAVYPGPFPDELGAAPVPVRPAHILSSTTVEGVHYAHVQLDQPARLAVLVHDPSGASSPSVTCFDSGRCDTDVLFEELTSAQGRELAAAEGSETALQRALEAARQAWETGQREQHIRESQDTLSALAGQVRSGALDEAGYRDRAGPVWDEVFPLLEGRGPLETGDDRRWYVPQEEDGTRAWEAGSADPLEAVVAWAERDGLDQRCVIRTGTAGSPDSTYVPVKELLAQIRPETPHQGQRLGQALVVWLLDYQVLIQEEFDMSELTAWRQAGWVWQLRTGAPVPSAVRDHLPQSAAAAVFQGVAEMEDAQRGPDGAVDVPGEQLRAQFMLLAAASASLEEARPHARAALDRLLRIEPEPPDGEQPVQDVARLAYLARELGLDTVAEVLEQPADRWEASAVHGPVLGALPARLHAAPEAAQKLVSLAEQAVARKAQHQLYEDHPDPDVREEHRVEADGEGEFVLHLATAEATRGQSMLRAQTSPPPAADLPKAAESELRGQSAAQRVALDQAPPQGPGMR